MKASKFNAFLGVEIPPGEDRGEGLADIITGLGSLDNTRIWMFHHKDSLETIFFRAVEEHTPAKNRDLGDVKETCPILDMDDGESVLPIGMLVVFGI